MESRGSYSQMSGEVQVGHCEWGEGRIQHSRRGWEAEASDSWVILFQRNDSQVLEGDISELQEYIFTLKRPFQMLQERWARSPPQECAGSNK